MINHKFEMNTFDGECICFPYKSIIVCNKNIKNAILNNQLELEVSEPYIIMTNDKLSDEEVNVLEDASIADCLSLYRSEPAFGGILV